jgi:hypothetical protein
MKKLIVITIGLIAVITAMGQRKEPPRKQGGGGYNIEQACSDRAQLNTIAFDALGFLTGDLCSSTFLPPGKVSDYFGFQYMRDIDTGTGGHNTNFLTRIANNTWVILNKNQKDQLIALAREQAERIQDLARKRFPLIKAFHRELDGNIPPGTQGLNQEAVKKYSGDLFELDGLLGYRRAQIFGAVARSLNETQKAFFSKLVFGRSDTETGISSATPLSSPSRRHHRLLQYSSGVSQYSTQRCDRNTHVAGQQWPTIRDVGKFHFRGKQTHCPVCIRGWTALSGGG